MNKFKLAVGVILLFIVGVLAGSLGTGIYYKKRVERFESGGPPVSERVGIVLGRFSNDLKLTKEQRDEIGKIVRESQEKILALGRETFPEIEEINEQSLSLIEEKLDSEQKKKLDELYQRMNDFRRRTPEQGTSQRRTPGQTPPQGAPGQAPPQGEPGQTPPQGAPGQAPQQAGPEQSPRQRTPESVPPREDDMRFLENLKERLNLSQEQEAKVRSIMEESAKEREKVLEKYRSDLAEIEKSLENGLSSILTKEQMEKYRTNEEKGSFEMPRSEVPL